METGAGLLTIAMVILGIACIYYMAEDEIGPAIALCVLQVLASVAATVLCCLYSPTYSYACGIVFTVTTGLLIIVQFFFDADADLFEDGVILPRVMFFTSLACAFGGYLNVYAFFEFAVSLSVIFVLVVVSIVIKRTCSDVFLAGDIAAAVIAAAGLIVGYCMYAEIKKGASVAVGCYVYKYDDVNSTVDKNNQSELYFNEYYAFQIDFEWKNLMAYNTQSEQIRIQVSFPAAVDYVSSGMKFEASSDNKIWTYDFELNAKSVDEMKSGYFVFNYSYDTISKPIEPFNVRIGLVPSDKDSKKEEKPEKIFIEYDHDYKYNFIKKNYPFTDADIIKDLSQADNGSYRITPPDGCEQLKIKIYNHDKTGVYYSGNVDCGADDYRLSILRMLESNVIESVYNQIVENKESLIVEITAVGNSVYDDTSVSFTYNID